MRRARRFMPMRHRPCTHRNSPRGPQHLLSIEWFIPDVLLATFAELRAGPDALQPPRPRRVRAALRGRGAGTRSGRKAGAPPARRPRRAGDRCAAVFVGGAASMPVRWRRAARDASRGCRTGASSHPEPAALARADAPARAVYSFPARARARRGHRRRASPRRRRRGGAGRSGKRRRAGGGSGRRSNVPAHALLMGPPPQVVPEALLVQTQLPRMLVSLRERARPGA